MLRNSCRVPAIKHIFLERGRQPVSMFIVGGSVFSRHLQWLHNERDGVSNHRRLDCLFDRLFRQRYKTPKLCVIGFCEGNSPVTGELPAQRPSNAENVSIWWRHHDLMIGENRQEQRKWVLVNPPLMHTFIRQITCSSMMQIMACHLFGVKSLHR